MRYFRKRTGFRKRRVFKRPRRVYRKKGSGLRRLIKKVVDRKLETKQYVQLVMNQVNIQQTNGSGLATNTSYILPPIAPGTGNGQRIGDAISIKSMKYKVYLNISTAQGPPNIAQTCRVIIYSLKDYQQDVGTNLPSIEYANFFRNGTSTATCNGYLGNDDLLPINRQRIIVHAERIVTLGANVSPSTAQTLYANSVPSKPAQKMLYFDVTKHFKSLKYDENTVNPNLPINHNLWCTILVNNADATLGNGFQSVQTLAMADIHYKDA